MKYSLVATSVVGLLGAVASRGDNALPAHPSFDRYSAMVGRSPFAIATAVALPAATPDFAKDLYVANAARFPGGDLITIASSADQNFKKYLTTRQTVDGFSITGIEWSDRVGATRVTISKDGKFATLTFNQQLLSQRAAPKGPPVPEQVPPSMPPMQAAAVIPTPQDSAPRVTRKPGAPASVPNPAEVDPQQQRQEREAQRRQQKASGPKRPPQAPPPGETGETAPVRR